ncbi:MAG: hypothetical protein DRR19_12785 [Candidatus Parabeggiatoa sp. nov. 1]|nr:MAG: hypothetical protein DRR19_12785 [Gammaproteobacteria bacterium]
MYQNKDAITPDTTKSEKSRVVSVTPSKNGQPNQNQDRTTLLSSVRPAVLDQKLRDAETSLQQLENTQTQALAMAEGVGAGVGSVDKIRDLLFGGQMRDYDKRFKRLEEHVAQESRNFRDDVFQRIKTIEERMDGEIDSLSEKAKLDRQERQSSLSDLERDIKALKNELNARFTQLDEQVSRELRNLRQQTLNKFQELTMQQRQQNDSLTGLINQEVAFLQDEKVNRSDLAAFFNEMAVRLTKNFDNPSEEE